MIYKDLGMVSQVLDERRIPSLTGDLAVAHCRYSTTGSTVWENAQPTLRLGPRRALAIGHNGNLVNTRELLDQLDGGRGRLAASTDTELLTALLADEPAADTVDALRRVLPRVRGAFSLVILDEDQVIGVRDPHGFRPLVLGRLPIPSDGADGPGLWGDDTAGWILASETAALDIVGAEYVRDVEPGEIVVLEPGREPRLGALRRGHARAVRVRAHLLRPPGLVHGGPQPVRGAAPHGDAAGDRAPRRRRRPRDAGARHGRAGRRRATPRQSGIPYREGMVRNRYSGRTFIQPSQAMRQRGVNVKLSPLREVVRDRSLVVVDDSIVRGTTTKQIVGLLRRAGAREIHVRISAPPIYHPCFYGIDTSIETELIASTHSVEEIREFIGADTLGYLSIRGVLAALELPYEQFCFACFDGNYPEPVPYDVSARKFLLETVPRERRPG